MSHTSFIKSRKFSFTCALCSRLARAADVKAKYCWHCMIEGPLCACGCGNHTTNAFRKYIIGHAVRDKANEAIALGHQSQAKKISGASNPSKRPEVIAKIRDALKGRIVWQENKTQTEIDAIKDRIVLESKNGYARAAQYKWKDVDNNSYRSRFELQTAEFLKSSGIPFVYEQPLRLSDNRSVYPDFTLEGCLIEVSASAFNAWRKGFVAKLERIRRSYPLLPIVVITKGTVAAALAAELAKLAYVRICCFDSLQKPQSLVVESDYFNFDYSHFLPWHKGQCASFHGHSSTVSVAIFGYKLKNGMLVDFKRLKAVCKRAIKLVDHKLLAPSYAVKISKKRAIVEFVSKKQKHRLDLPANEVAVLPSDSTVENISQLLATSILNMLPYNVLQVLVQMNEGIGKACISGAYGVQRTEINLLKLPEGRQSFLKMIEFYKSIPLM